MPTDSEDRLEKLELDAVMRSVQAGYADELDRQGFPDQSFKLLTNKLANRILAGHDEDDDKIVVFKIRGNHDKAHYSKDTQTLVLRELGLDQNDGRGFGVGTGLLNILVIVMAGMESLDFGTALGLAVVRPGGQFFHGKDYGFALVAETEDIEQTIMHELGHVFGLWHLGQNDHENNIMGNGRKLKFHQARWLSKNHYFIDFDDDFEKNIRLINPPPWIESKFLKIESLGDILQYSVDVGDEDNDGVHQVYLIDDRTQSVLAWDFMKDNQDTAVFEVERKLVIPDWLEAVLVEPYKHKVWLFAMDNNGNWIFDIISKFLPEQRNQAQDIVSDDSRSVSPKEKLTTMWAKIKNE